MKRIPALIFTAHTTHVTTWAGSPPIPAETRRIEISRDLAARMLRKARKKELISPGLSDAASHPRSIALI